MDQVVACYALPNKLFMTYGDQDDLQTGLFQDGNDILDTPIGSIKLNIRQMSKEDYNE